MKVGPTPQIKPSLAFFGDIIEKKIISPKPVVRPIGTGEQPFDLEPLPSIDDDVSVEELMLLIKERLEHLHEWARRTEDSSR